MALSRVCLVLLAAAAVSGCQSKVREPVVAAGAPPAPPVLPTGTGCGPEIARTKAIVDSDLASGNLNQPVADRFHADLNRAAAACGAGHEAEARGLLAAAKARYGYR